jgi:hypothetical protein
MVFHVQACQLLGRLFRNGVVNHETLGRDKAMTRRQDIIVHLSQAKWSSGSRGWMDRKGI